MGQKVTVDTNVLLDNPDILLRQDIDFVVPYVVLAELDKLKRQQDLSFSARNAIKSIMKGYKDGTIRVVGIPNDLQTNDEKIVETAKEEDSLLWSRDVGANVIALTKSVGLFEDDIQEYDKEYTGMRELIVPQEWYYDFICKVNDAQHAEVEVPLEELLQGNPININEYVVFKPNDESLNSIIFRKTTEKFVHVSSSNKIFKTLSKDGRKVDIEFLSDEQVCAFDAVFNTDTPLCIIQGRVGSSKTLISTLAALCRVAGTHANQRYSKIIVSRPNIPVNKQWSIGYVKGDADEKMKHWLSGFTSNLEFLYDSRHSSDDGKDRPSEIVWKEYFQPQALEAIQGASFNGKILVLDETQLVDVDTLQQVMTRTANGSKLVLLLDPNQTYGANRGNEGYKRILPHVKGNPLVSYVNLQNIYRSELTAFVAEIFKGN